MARQFNQISISFNAKKIFQRGAEKSVKRWGQIWLLPPPSSSSSASFGPFYFKRFKNKERKKDERMDGRGRFESKQEGLLLFSSPSSSFYFSYLTGALTKRMEYDQDWRPLNVFKKLGKKNVRFLGVETLSECHESEWHLKRHFKFAKWQRQYDAKWKQKDRMP